MTAETTLCRGAASEGDGADDGRAGLAGLAEGIEGADGTALAFFATAVAESAAGAEALPLYGTGRRNKQRQSIRRFLPP